MQEGINPSYRLFGVALVTRLKFEFHPVRHEDAVIEHLISNVCDGRDDTGLRGRFGVKRRGRPATGRDLQIGTRWPDETVALIDAWAAAQDDEPGRSEAIRRLVELGLKTRK